MQTNDNDAPKGIGGWLILVAIGLAVAPVRLLKETIAPIHEMLTDGSWSALAEMYPYLGALMIGELVINSLLICGSFWLIYLFISKHYLFPRIYIVLIAMSLAFLLIDTWLVTWLVPEVPMFDEATILDLLRGTIVAMIWIPYMLVSRRVKATFVENMPEKRAQPTADSIS